MPTLHPPPSSPRLPWNHWETLQVPDLGAWEPVRPVTIVMPYYQAPDALRLTLAAFARQTYPRDLLQVVVVDDGSDPPLVLPDDLDLDGLRVDVVHQEDRGFGLARARNTGAKAADGEILIFVDCDMVPEPWHVEAHARWHHTAADLVVLGFRRHVEFGGITTDALAAVDPAVGLEPLFADRDVQIPTWIDDHMERTNNLTTMDHALFRPVTGGNLSMRADTYWRVGGSDESFTQWGAEDTELGYRLFIDGAVLVPDRSARCWHQGHGHEPTESERASLGEQQAKLAHLIAHPGFRSWQPGRSFQVPRVVVTVDVGLADDRESVVATVESVLGGRFTDLQVLLGVHPDHPDHTWLQRQFEPDPRVHVNGNDPQDRVPHAPVEILTRPGVTVGNSTIGDLVGIVESDTAPAGIVEVTSSGRPGDTAEVLVEARLRRAWRRAARAATPDEDVRDVVTDLFGCRVLMAEMLGVTDPDLVTDDEAPAPAAASTLEPPPAPRVAGNRWDTVQVPALRQWTPRRPVTVVMPYYQAPDALAVTLSAFARQTYPMGLFDIVVVDDGSTPPLHLPDDLDLGDLRVTVLHQEDRGFGAPRARNFGSREATGEILVFVDCDMVPEPWFVEAHARWHHAAADLVVLGFRTHVDFDGIAPADVASMDPAAGITPLVGDRPTQVPDWIEGHMLRTDDLTSSERDLFRPVASGNLSVRAEEFWRVGGFDESFTQWGGEDTELGYRLFVDGAVLVPDREAHAWHQGAGHEPSETEWQSLENQRAKLAHLIADRGFRSSKPGRHFTVPRIALRVAVDDGVGRDAVTDTVEALLGGSFTDILVVVQIPEDHPDHTWLERQFAPDPKVVVREPGTLGSLDRDARHAPIRGSVDPGVVVGPDTLLKLVATLESVDDPVGLVHVTVPGRRPDDPDGMLELWLTRAHRRALRIAGPGEPIAPLVGELFGERWVAGSELGVHDREVDPPTPGGPATSSHDAGSLDEIADLWQVFRNLAPDEREVILAGARTGLEVLGPRERRLLVKVARRVMLITAALRTLFAARSAGNVIRGVVAVLKAVLPAPLYAAIRQLGRPIIGRLRALRS